MGGTIKRLFFATVLFCSLVFLGSPTLTNAAGGKTEEKPSATESASSDEEAAKESSPDVEVNIESKPEPPSGPNTNIETIEEEVEIETPASVTGEKMQGTGTVTDFSTSGSKAFYTITDKNHNVFYLIIDLEKTDNNVYFLSDINKSDLEGEGNPETPIVTPPVNEQLEAEQAEAPKESGNGSFLIIVLLVAGVGVAAYYFLVMKKRQGQGTAEDDEDEMMMDDYFMEEEMIEEDSNDYDESQKDNRENQ